MERPVDSQTEALTVLAALSHPTRLALFRGLPRDPEAEQTLRALAEAYACDLPTLNLHLAHLMRAGLVRAARAGAQVVYCREPQAWESVVAFLRAGALPDLPPPEGPAPPQVQRRVI